MIITKKHLPRRSFLRGALGTMVALPFLDAMTPALSAQSKARPFRFGAIYIPNVIYPQLWHPDKTGSDFEFKPIMKPLEPYRNYLVTISKMKAPDGNPENGGVHMGASAAFLNGTGPLTQQANYTVIKSKKTIDQFIADKVSEDTPLHSLQVGTEDMGTSVGACDGFGNRCPFGPSRIADVSSRRSQRRNRLCPPRQARPAGARDPCARPPRHRHRTCHRIGRRGWRPLRIHHRTHHGDAVRARRRQRRDRNRRSRGADHGRQRGGFRRGD